MIMISNEEIRKIILDLPVMLYPTHPSFYTKIKDSLLSHCPIFCSKLYMNDQEMIITGATVRNKLILHEGRI